MNDTRADDGPIELNPEDLGPGRILLVHGRRIWIGRGQELWRSDDGGASFQFVATAPTSPLGRALANNPWTSRFLRAGFHGLEQMRDGTLMAIVRGGVLRLEPGARAFERVHTVDRGTRPLGICIPPDGPMAFGEYFQNRERGEVHIYASRDGREFEVAHTFPAGSVRHIHSIVHDPYRKGQWVLTGDDGDEVGLWWTQDQFRSLEPVVRGVQNARAVTVLPTRDAVIVPMDSPVTQNHIQALDPSTGNLRVLGSVPGSVFFATRAGNMLFLSTAVEKSQVNLESRSVLFGSLDGEQWIPIHSFERDLPALRDRRGYLQYPTLVLPSGSPESSDLYGSGQALADHHGRVLRWDRDALHDHLATEASRDAAPSDPSILLPAQPKKQVVR